MEKIESESDLISELEKQLNSNLSEYLSSPVKLQLVYGEAKPKVEGIIRREMKPNKFYLADLHLNDSYLKLVKAFYPLFVIKPAIGSVIAFPSFAKYGAVIDSPIPSAIIVKRVKLSLLERRRAFIPVSNETLNAITKKGFDHSKIFKEKIGWNPLVEQLNQDNELEAILESLPNEIRWSDYRGEIKDDNLDLRETLGYMIPVYRKTLILFHHAATWSETLLYRIKDLQLPNIRGLIKMMSKIAKYIKEFKYNGPVDEIGIKLLIELNPEVKLFIKLFAEEIKRENTSAN